MPKIRYAILGLLIAATASTAGTSALSLKLTALDPVVKSGSKVIVQVDSINESDKSITYHNTSTDCDYSVKVLMSTGSLAPETSVKKQLNCAPPGLRITGRDIVITLKPGESNSEQLELTWLFDMSAPGEYSVQIERTFPDIGRFHSNSVKIKVTP